MDLLNIIFLIIGIAISILGICAGYRIARKSGSFDRPQLDVVLFSQSIIQENQFSEIIFGLNTRNEVFVQCFLPFKIKNNGNLSAKNISLRILMPDQVCGFNDDISELMEFKGAYDKSEVKMSSFSDNNFKYIDLRIPELHPHGSALFEIPINISSLIIPLNVNATTKDKVPVNVKGHFKLATNIRILISGENISSNEGSFRIRSYYSSNYKELGDKIMDDETKKLRREKKKTLLNGSKLNDKDRAEWEQLISRIYAPGVREKTIVIMLNLKKINLSKQDYKKMKGNIYIEQCKNSERFLITPPRDITQLSYY